MGAFVEKSKGFATDLWLDRPRLYFTVAYLLAWGGTLWTLGGLAAVTAFCFDQLPDTGLGAGFKTPPGIPTTSMPYVSAVMKMEKTKVTDLDGTFRCDRFFRMDWFLWSFQVVFLLIVGLVWYRRTLQRYQSAIASLCAAVSAWHFYKIDYVITLEPYTQGQLHTDGIIIGGGLIFCCIGNFLTMFALGNYGPRMLPPRGETPSPGVSSYKVSEGENGSGWNTGAPSGAIQNTV